jgi:hypothetical protein
MSCRRMGLAGPLSSCWLLVGQAVLQAGVAELVDGPDRAQDAAAAGVFEEPHEMHRSPVRRGELREREGGWPRLRISDPDPEPDHKPGHKPEPQRGQKLEHEPAPATPVRKLGHEPQYKPGHKPGYKPGHEPERSIAAP